MSTLNVNSIQTAGGASPVLTADIAKNSELIASSGSSLVGHIASGTGSVATTVQAKLRERVSVKDFGAVGNGVTNDTTAIQAAIDAVFLAGGGTVYFPPGNYLVSTISKDWAIATTSIVLKGSGERATLLTKTGATTTPILNLSATLGSSDGIYSTIEDMSIVGIAKSSPGLRLTGVARFVLKRVAIIACDVGLDVVGSLIGSLRDCDILANNTGIKTRVSGAMYCNLIAIYGGSIRNNTTWGIDIGSANGFNTFGVDIEANGTSLNTATGQVITRSTVDDEIGYSNISFSAGWFEGGLGTNFSAENAAGLTLSFQDLPVISSEAGRAFNIGAISKLVLNRVTAGSVGDTLTVGATGSCAISDSTINVLSDSSSAKNYQNITTSAGLIQSFITGPGGTYTTYGNAVNSGSGFFAGVVSGVAQTLFAPSLLSGGLFQVFVYMDSAGGAYMATARVGVDRANVTRLGGENGANMTITVSGSDVKATQTSGSNQTIIYFYQRVSG